GSSQAISSSDLQSEKEAPLIVRKENIQFSVLAFVPLRDPIEPGSYHPRLVLLFNLVGSVASGIFSDKFGRKMAFDIILMVLMAVCFLYFSGIVVSFMFFIVIIAFLGGATSTVGAIFISETMANKMNRGSLIARQFLGELFGQLVSMITIIISSSSVSQKYKDYYFTFNNRWMSVVVATATMMVAGYTYLFWVKRIPESPRYTYFVWNNSRKAASDAKRLLIREVTNGEEEEATVLQNLTFGLFSWEFYNLHGWHLLGVTATSFVNGINYLTQLLFLNLIFHQYALLVPPSKPELLLFLAMLMTVTTVLGFLCQVFLIDRINRFCILFACFCIKAVLMVLVLLETPWKKKDNITELCVYYVLCNIIYNFANATNFVVAAEIFPTRMRGTCHGITVAGNRLGLFLAIICLFVAGHYFQLILGFLACINVIPGIAASFLVKESKGKTLEDASNEHGLDNKEYVKVGLGELERWCIEATDEYVGSAWEELKHIEQAVGFLVKL
ncbi:hypothetical protein HN51_021147, partial [Arachis hypogaea]